MTEKDDSTFTEVKTMWSETLLEALYAAMEKKASAAKVREILKELKEKGYKKDYLVEKVSKKVGPDAAAELKRFYISSSARTGSSAKKQNAGLVSKLKGLFK